MKKPSSKINSTNAASSPQKRKKVRMSILLDQDIRELLMQIAEDEHDTMTHILTRAILMYNKKR